MTLSEYFWMIKFVAGVTALLNESITPVNQWCIGCSTRVSGGCGVKVLCTIV